MPLARGLRTHQQGQIAGRVETRLGKLVGRKARLLDIDGVADAAVAAAGPRRCAPARETRHVRGSERVIEIAGEIAAVIDEPERRRIGHRLRPDEVAAAQFVWRDAELARGVIDQALDCVGGLRPAGAAIGINRNGIGIDALDRDMDRRKRIDSTVHDRAGEGRNLRGKVRQIRTHVGGQFDR